MTVVARCLLFFPAAAVVAAAANSPAAPDANRSVTSGGGGQHSQGAIEAPVLTIAAAAAASTPKQPNSIIELWHFLCFLCVCSPAEESGEQRCPPLSTSTHKLANAQTVKF